MKEDGTIKAKLMLISSMLIFGTIGIFRRAIPLSSAMLAMARGVLGVLSLLLLLLALKKKLSLHAIRQNAARLIVSGVFIGLNWILLFEAYNYTTVAVATLCYYMAPVFVLLASPLLLGERLSLRKVFCILLAFAGMALVSGVLQTGGGNTDFRGVLFGLGAALLYAAVIILNQKIHGIPAYDRTVTQLFASAATLLPYVLFTEGLSFAAFTPKVALLVLIVGVLNTGVAYALYFGSMEKLNAQTVALFGYIDPIVAILLSAIVLHEKMTPAAVIGTLCVLGATVISELPERGKTAVK